MTGFETPMNGLFGRIQSKAPARPDRQVRCRKRRACEGYCGLTIEVGDQIWILAATEASLCTDCYDVRQGGRS